MKIKYKHYVDRLEKKIKIISAKTKSIDVPGIHIISWNDCIEISGKAHIKMCPGSVLSIGDLKMAIKLIEEAEEKMKQFIKSQKNLKEEWEDGRIYSISSITEVSNIDDVDFHSHLGRV